MPEPYLLGIDVGTSVLKCVVFDRHGTEVAISRRRPTIIREHPSWSELSMHDLWEEVKDALREVTADEAIKGGKIQGVGTTGTCCSSWLVDENAEPVRNAILWNDGRAAEIIGEWQRSDVMDEVFAISGNIVFPGYTVAVLRWLKEHEPETLHKARWSLFCKDWIRYCLTGEIHTDHTDAAYLPYDIRETRYSSEVLDLCGVSGTEHLFPPILDPGDVAGSILPSVAEQTGLPSDIPVVAGMVDVAASTLGAGAYKPGQACSVVGTSFLNNFITEGPTFEPFGVGVQTPSAGDGIIRSMINTSGTINLEWFLNQFCAEEKVAAEKAGRTIYDWAEEVAGDIPIGAQGIVYHPYLNTTGVIAPFLNPAARAQFFGVSIEHTRAHLLRAVYEGAALSMLDCYAQIPVEIDEWYISGGGKRSAFWSQMFSDCTGQRILVPEGVEFGARSVAVLAGIACGVYDDLDDAMKQVIRIEREHTPNKTASEKYRQLYELYQAIYEQLQDVWWKRHELVKRWAQ